MHEVSRRAALGAGAAAVGLAVAGAPASANAAVKATPAPSRSHYTAFVGRQFLAVRGRARRRVRLVAIENLHPATAAQREQCFNLIFAPVTGAPLGEGIYRLHRAGTHTSELFLSGVGSGVEVQALVNRAR